MSHTYPGLIHGVPGLGSGASALNYLFRDLFSDTVSAGAYHDTASVPGIGTRTATDTESKMSGDGANLICAGGKAVPAFGDPAIVFNPDDPIVRVAGTVLRYTFTPRNVVTASGCFHGLSNALLASVSLSTFSNHGLRFQGSGGQIVFNDGSGNRVIGTYAADIDYIISVILRATGAFLLIRGGAYGDDYDVLLYPCNSGTDTPLYPAFYNANMIFDVDNLEVIDLSSTQWSGANGLAVDSDPAPIANAEIDTAWDSFIEFTWTPQAAETLELSFRYLDADNRWYVQADQAGGTIKLFYIEAGGTPVEVDAGKTQTWTAGTPYRIVICDSFRDIRTFVANVLKHTVDQNLGNIKYITGSYKAKTSLSGANLIAHPKYSTVNTGSAISQRHVFERAYAKNADAALNIVFPDGSTEGVHPDVVDTGVAGWNGYRYWMAVTGYQDSDPNDENPCIFASEDKVTWIVPDGLTNPIEPDPASGINSDTDLILINNALWCIWRYTDGANDVIYARSSTDGVDWSNKITLLTVAGNGAECLSPAVVHINNQYIMMSVKRSGAGPFTYTLERRSASAIDGVWSEASTATITVPTGYTLWHHDVILDGSRLWMLLHMPGTEGGLFLAYSDDSGSTWTVQSEPFMTRNLNDALAWDRTSIYRGSILKTANGFDCWYSAFRDNAGTDVWGIGFTEIVYNG